MAKKFTGPAADFINSIRTMFIGKGADPNAIFVQDLYNYNPPKNTMASALMGKNQIDYARLSKEQRTIIESILNVYNEHIATKRELLTQSRQLAETDIVRTVIDVMIDDGFNSFIDEKDEFRIEYVLDEDEKKLLGDDFQQNVQNMIDEFVEKFSLKRKVIDIIPDLLRDGEYAFGVTFDEEKRTGIKDIIDDIEVFDLLPFYEGDKVAFIMKQDSLVDIKHNPVTTPPKFYKPDNFVFFTLDGNIRKRINLSTMYGNDFRKTFFDETGIRLPKFIRIPVPIYYGAMKHLNRLQIMENVSTVVDLQDIIKPEIVTVTVPSNTTSDDAKKIIRDYEHQLNDIGDLSDTSNFDIASMAAQATRRKVLPQWMDTKGTLGRSEVGSNDSAKSQAAWDSISRLTNLIALSIGIPPFYINPADTPQEKLQTIKTFSRYTRKLTSLQKTIADGVKAFIMLHLSKMNVNISIDNLSVKFKTITSGDTLDDTDVLVGNIQGLNDLYKGITEITEGDNNLAFNSKQFKQLFDSRTSKFLNCQDLIYLVENENQTGNPEGEEMSGGGFDEGPDFDNFGDADFEPASNTSADQLDTGFEQATNTETGDAAYDNYASANDGITAEGPQEITTEV